MNRAQQLFAAAALSLALVTSAAASQLVVNGGFESQDFSGWTLTNNAFSGVECVSMPDPDVYEGLCSAFFGTIGSETTLSQSFPTFQPGKTYSLSFALRDDDGVPSSFHVAFDGIPLVDLIDSPAFDYHVYSFDVTSASNDPTLLFSFRNDAAFFNLDAVSLSVPEPASIALVGVGLVGLLVTRKRGRRVA